MLVMLTMKKKKKIDDYIGVAKTDIYVYIVFAIIFFLFLLYLSYWFKYFFPLFFEIACFMSIHSKLATYNNLKKIKKYLENNNLLEKIGKIDFWNGESYFLTENYMIIINNGVINHFAYSDIKQMYKKTYHGSNFGSLYTQEYLHIRLKDYTEYKVLIYSTCLVNEDFRDISGYLLQKNKNINIG